MSRHLLLVLLATCACAAAGRERSRLSDEGLDVLRSLNGELWTEAPRGFHNSSWYVGEIELYSFDGTEMVAWVRLVSASGRCVAMEWGARVMVLDFAQLPFSTDGDAADFYARVTGSRYSGLSGERGRLYLEAMGE